MNCFETIFSPLELIFGAASDCVLIVLEENLRNRFLEPILHLFNIIFDFIIISFVFDGTAMKYHAIVSHNELLLAMKHSRQTSVSYWQQKQQENNFKGGHAE